MFFGTSYFTFEFRSLPHPLPTDKCVFFSCIMLILGRVGILQTIPRYILYLFNAEIVFSDFKGRVARSLWTSGEDSRGIEFGAKGNDIIKDKARKSTTAYWKSTEISKYKAWLRLRSINLDYVKLGKFFPRKFWE